MSVQDSAEGQAIAERGSHVGDAHVPVALALLPAPFLQGFDGGHAGGKTGWRLEELATGPARARDAEEARTRRPPAGLEEESSSRPEGDERQLREGRGLRAHPSLAQPAGPLLSRPGDSWAGPPRAAAPPSRPGGCRCGIRCQSGTSGAVFDSLARIATVSPCPIAAPVPGCRM